MRKAGSLRTSGPPHPQRPPHAAPPAPHTRAHSHTRSQYLYLQEPPGRRSREKPEQNSHPQDQTALPAGHQGPQPTEGPAEPSGPRWTGETPGEGKALGRSMAPGMGSIGSTCLRAWGGPLPAPFLAPWAPLPPSSGLCPPWLPPHSGSRASSPSWVRSAQCAVPTMPLTLRHTCLWGPGLSLRSPGLQAKLSPRSVLPCLPHRDPQLPGRPASTQDLAHGRPSKSTCIYSETAARVQLITAPAY